MNLTIARVQTWHQAKELLGVRNACREGMTHNVEHITEAEQWHFWENELLAPDPKYHAYLFSDGASGFGYGMLKVDGDKVWMTFGMIPEYRRRRLSRPMIQIITQIGYTLGDEVWIDVWDDNFALRSDIREGYEFVESTVDDRTLHVMKHRRDLALGEREAERLGEYVGIVRELIEVDDIARAAYG